jgi:hypothetical protein
MRLAVRFWQTGQTLSFDLCASSMSSSNFLPSHASPTASTSDTGNQGTTFKRWKIYTIKPIKQAKKAHGQVWTKKGAASG